VLFGTGTAVSADGVVPYLSGEANVCGSVTQIGCDGFNLDNSYQQQLGSTGSGLPPASLSGTFGLPGAQISAQLYALA
jgi:hypothetical protein